MTNCLDGSRTILSKADSAVVPVRGSSTKSTRDRVHFNHVIEVERTCALSALSLVTSKKMAVILLSFAHGFLAAAKS